MKRILLMLTLISISFIGMAQTSKSEAVYHSDSTASKAELYSNALSFFAINFKSANTVIQMADPISGQVIGKGIVNGRDVTISIFCKDGRYKYDISITTRENEITLPITSLGPNMLNNTGITKVPVLTGGIVNKNRAYFKYSNSQSGMYKYYYDGGSGHYPAVMTGGMWKKWKIDVDAELSKQKYKELGDIPELEFDYLIQLLITHMNMNINSNW